MRNILITALLALTAPLALAEFSVTFEWEAPTVYADAASTPIGAGELTKYTLYRNGVAALEVNAPATSGSILLPECSRVGVTVTATSYVGIESGPSNEVQVVACAPVAPVLNGIRIP